MTFRHKLWLDYETRSRVDLIKHGGYRYRDCPDHRILVAGWALDDGPGQWALIGPDWQGFPIELHNMLADKRVQVRAHNAAFDRLQMKDRAPPIERWYCTAAQARAMALPGSLDKLGRALKLPIGKNPAGKNLIRQLSIPDKHGNFDNDPKAMRRFGIYCGEDVTVMREASKMMPELRDEDLRVYWASERINDRGLPIDTELCRLAVQYAAAEKIEAQARVVALTGGLLTKTGGKKLTEWVYARLDPHLQKHMDTIVWKVVGVDAGRRKAAPGAGSENLHNAKEKVPVPGKTLASDIRAKLLDIATEFPGSIDPEVVEMIEACEAGSLSSTAKFQTMLDRVSSDGRLRGAFMFNGAYQTNRWSAHGAQVHNFPRLVAADPEAILAKMRRGEPLDNVLLTLKSMLRPAIKPKDGKHIVRADWNAVEARGLPWLANNEGAKHYMLAFTEEGRDIYVEQALAAGLGDNRQAGKVVVLALGFGGSTGSLAVMSKNYDVRLTDPDRIVLRWRKSNPWAADKRTGWWASLGRCAMSAMNHPGQGFRAGRVVLASQVHGDDQSLTMLLPSGRTVWYPYARIVPGTYGPEIAYLKASWSPQKGVEEWPTARLWHGVTAENADQAVCADLLREAIVRAEDEGLEPIGHVHDEIITEASPRKAKAKGQALQRCMLVTPKWAAGFPLKVEVDISPRFRK